MSRVSVSWGEAAERFVKDVYKIDGNNVYLYERGSFRKSSETGMRVKDYFRAGKGRAIFYLADATNESIKAPFIALRMQNAENVESYIINATIMDAFIKQKPPKKNDSKKIVCYCYIPSGNGMHPPEVKEAIEEIETTEHKPKAKSLIYHLFKNYNEALKKAKAEVKENIGKAEGGGGGGISSGSSGCGFGDGKTGETGGEEGRDPETDNSQDEWATIKFEWTVPQPPQPPQPPQLLPSTQPQSQKKKQQQSPIINFNFLGHTSTQECSNLEAFLNHPPKTENYAANVFLTDVPCKWC